MPIKFWVYLSKRYFLSIISVVIVLAMLIALVDFVEILRRSYGYDISFPNLLSICFYKIPYFLQLVLPFAILISTALTISDLNRNNELIAARALGISIWNILTPFLIVALLIGIFHIFFLNKIVSSTLKQQMILDQKYLSHDTSDITITDKGIWLKETNKQKLSRLIFAKSLYNRGEFLSEATIINFNDNFEIQNTYLVDHIIIGNGEILLVDAKRIMPSGDVIKIPRITLASSISIEKLQQTIVIPEIVPFTDLPKFIKYMQKAGFSTLKHTMYFYQLCFFPIFLSSLVLVSTTVLLSLPRKGKISLMMSVGIMIGFIVYFINKTMAAFGAAGIVPPFIAALAPALLCFTISISFLLHKEDG